MIAFVFGSLILIDTDQPGYDISLPLIFAVGGASAFILAFVVGLALKSHRRPVVSGREEMLGASGYAVTAFETQGTVHVHGEMWQARTDQPLEKNQTIRVTGREGMVLSVTPNDEEAAS